MARVKVSIEFGSAYTNIYLLGSGLVLSEPTVAAVNEGDKFEVKCIGNEAKKLIGKTSKNTKIVFPVFEGEIVNEKVAIAVLKGFLKKVGVNEGVFGDSALFSLPCGADSNMMKNLYNVAKGAGLSKVYFAESPVLSAIGNGVPLSESKPCFVIDLEGGITSIAAVSLTGVIAGVSINLGVNKISTDIIDFIAEKHGLQIGLLTAERLRKEIGSLEEGDILSSIVNGRDASTGTPRAISLSASDMAETVKEYFDKIAEVAVAVLKKLPPEVSAEIRHAGIYLSGLGSTVYGLDKYYGKKFDMQININENAVYAVAIGGGTVIGDHSLLEKLAFQFEA